MSTRTPGGHGGAVSRADSMGPEAVEDLRTVEARLGDHPDCAHYEDCLDECCRAKLRTKDGTRRWRRNVCVQGCRRYQPVESHAIASLPSSLGMWSDGQ